MKIFSPLLGKNKRSQQGFTLIELLVVIGILAVLLAITLIAINPRQNFQQANNTQRQSDVNTILNAINQYAAQNNGQLPAGITTTVKDINDTATTTDIDLCAILVSTYVADMPIDPVTGSKSSANCADSASTYDTGYTVVSSATGGRVTVSAPDAELGQTISVTR